MGLNSSFKPPKMIDNKRNGRVIDEIKDNIRQGTKLSVISAYFTIYAFSELKKELSRIGNMRFIFTEPTFVNKDDELIREYYLEKRNERSISGNEFEIKLRNEMKQAAIAKECARWLEDKVQIKSLKVPNAAQPRLVYIENQTVDFTSDGLGITKSDRIDSNMCVYGKEFSWTFLKQFDDTAETQRLSVMTSDIKETLPDVVTYLQNRTNLTRKTIVEILIQSSTLHLFKNNPQAYMEDASKCITSVMKLLIVDGIKYTKLGDSEYYAQELFDTQELTGYLERNMIESHRSV